MKKKQIPLWLENLPPGKYFLKYLVKHSGKHKNSVVRTLKRLGLKRELIQCYDSNFSEALYEWGGDETPE